VLVRTYSSIARELNRPMIERPCGLIASEAWRYRECAKRCHFEATFVRNSEILRKASQRSTDDASSIADRDSVPARSQRSVKLQWRGAMCHRLAVSAKLAGSVAAAARQVLPCKFTKHVIARVSAGCCRRRDASFLVRGKFDARVWASSSVRRDRPSECAIRRREMYTYPAL